MSTTKRRLTAILVAAVGLGCESGGESGTEGNSGACSRRGASTDLEEDTQTAYGTPAELAADLGLVRPTLLRYWSQDARVVLSNATIALEVDLQTAKETSRYEGEQPCTPVVEMKATMVLESDDGAFTEHIPGLVRVAGTTSFSGTLSKSSFEGSYELSPEVSSKGTFSVEVSLPNALGWSGGLNWLTANGSALVAEWPAR